jgi:hypothetical protein
VSSVILITHLALGQAAQRAEALRHLDTKPHLPLDHRERIAMRCPNRDSRVL